MRSSTLAKRALWAAFIANVIFGFSFLFTKVALQEASPFTLLAGRFGVAFVFATLLLLLRPSGFSLRGKPWGLLLILGLFHPVLYFLGETYGVLYTSSTFSAIMIALIPILSLFASAFYLREAPTKLQSLFCTLSVFGVLLITVTGGGGANRLKGVFLLLLAVAADVAFNLFTRKISISFTPFERTYVMFVIGFFVFFSLMLWESGGSVAPLLALFKQPVLCKAVLYLGVASSVVAFFLLNYANTYLPVTRTIVFVNVTTLVTVIGGLIFLHERLSPLALAATGLIVLGVWGVQRFAKPSAEGHLQMEEL